MKRNYILFSILSSAILATACSGGQTGSNVEMASPVSVTEVQESAIKKYNSTNGTAVSSAEVELTSDMAGEYHLQINPRTKQPYKLGDKVMAGEIIVKLTNREY